MPVDRAADSDQVSCDWNRVSHSFRLIDPLSGTAWVNRFVENLQDNGSKRVF